MKRLFVMTVGATLVSLSLLLAPLAFAEEAAKTETPAAATEKAPEQKPAKKVKKAKKAKKAAKKAEEKKAEEKPAPAAEEKK